MALSAAEREPFIERYALGASLVKAALATVPEAARQWRPGPGKWSVHEIVCHCADSETVAATRIRFVVAEKDPLVLGYDEAGWATTFDYHAHPLELAIAALETARANTVALLRRLPESAWAKVGKHSQSGRYGAEDWLRIYAEHLEKHTGQIERTLAAWQNSKA
jgi:hypothetical protein